MARTWQDNAREFGALTRQGKDVRLALLVACSVEPRTGQGTSHRSVGSKCSMSDFTRTALGHSGSKVNTNRVSRHLDAWNRMAEAGHVPAADTLTPADADTFGEVSEEVQAAFAETFTSITSERPTGGRPRDSKPEDAVAIIEKQGAEAVVDAMTPQQQASVEEVIGRRRHERLRPGHGTPEGKAAVASLSARNDAIVRIHLPVVDAASALQQVQRDWERYFVDLSPREKDEVVAALRDIQVVTGALQLNVELEHREE